TLNYFQNLESANSVVAEIRASGGTAIAIQADVRDSACVAQMIETVMMQFGRIDYVVNCAIGGLQQKPFMEMDWNDFQEQIDYQVKAVIQVMKAVYPAMKTRGGGAIVNVLSQVTAGVPPTRMADYVSAKHALLGLSKALAVEWASDKIRVNMVSPGL